MDLIKLRKQRRSQFWAEIIPYVGYVIQSGVAVLTLLLLIAFSAWYTSFLQQLPPDLPIQLIMLILLTPFAVTSNFRTYLRPADVVFLLPEEHRMGQYLGGSYRSSMIVRLFPLLLVFLTSWPMYIRSAADPKAFWLFALVLIALRFLSTYGAWKELFIISRSTAQSYRILRLLVIGLALAAWLWQSESRSLIFIGLLALTYAVALRIPPRHEMPWEKLIAAEKSNSARVMLILGWFVNVPQRQQKVYPRKWLSRIGGSIPWKKNTAYRFLITKSFLRSDVLSITFRAVLLGILLVAWNYQSWAGSAIYLFFLFVIGVQLSGLRAMHRESFWLHIYPLPPHSRGHSLTAFIFKIHVVIAVVLWLPMLAALPESWALVVGTLLTGIVLVWLYSRNLKNSLKKEVDDEE